MSKICRMRLLQVFPSQSRKDPSQLLPGRLHPPELKTYFGIPCVAGAVGFSATQCSNDTTAGSCSTRAPSSLIRRGMML